VLWFLLFAGMEVWDWGLLSGWAIDACLLMIWALYGVWTEESLSRSVLRSQTG
jgi:hypothetical protein